MDDIGQNVLSDVHVHSTATRESEHRYITRFFFNFKDGWNFEYCCQDGTRTSNKSSGNEQEVTSSTLVPFPVSGTDEDGDLVIPVPGSTSLCQEAKEVITIEHRFQTVLKDVGFQVWLGSLLLCDYLIDYSGHVKHHSVLDLGAGTGITSIVAAMFAKSVICTDYSQDIVNLAEKNWKRNSELLPALCPKQNVTFQVLDWTNHRLHEVDACTECPGEYVQSLCDTSLIIAAEVVYDDDLTDAFFQTIYHLLRRPPKKTVIMSVEKRIVFDSAWQDVCSPSYQHFLENMEDLCSVDEGGVYFDYQQIPSEDVPQYFQYGRIAQLELWQITSSFEEKKPT